MRSCHPVGGSPWPRWWHRMTEHGGPHEPASTRIRCYPLRLYGYRWGTSYRSVRSGNTWERRGTCKPRCPRPDPLTWLSSGVASSRHPNSDATESLLASSEPGHPRHARSATHLTWRTSRHTRAGTSSARCNDFVSAPPSAFQEAADAPESTAGATARRRPITPDRVKGNGGESLATWLRLHRALC